MRGRAIEVNNAAFIGITPGMLTVRASVDDTKVGTLITSTASPGTTLIVCPEEEIVPGFIDTAMAPGASVNV